MRAHERDFMIPPLQFGDALLYYEKGDFVDWVISVKTWSDVAHIEIYAGNDKSVASRNGIGVNIYDLRTAGLKYVLRPKKPVNKQDAMTYFYNKACGQKYAFWSLFAFWFAKWKADPKRQFCSEFATNWYRSGGFEPFDPILDADHVAPGTFLMSPEFDVIWKA